MSDKPGRLKKKKRALNFSFVGGCEYYKQRATSAFSSSFLSPTF